jgi:hypothetical protein
MSFNSVLFRINCVCSQQYTHPILCNIQSISIKCQVNVDIRLRACCLSSIRLPQCMNGMYKILLGISTHNSTVTLNLTNYLEFLVRFLFKKQIVSKCLLFHKMF